MEGGMKVGRDVRLANLPELGKVLRKWCNLIRDESWLENGIVPWWFNERASLSTFAGAVWKTGGLVLEEYSMVKKPRKTSQVRDEKLGRTDIFFRTGDGDSFVAESKMTRVRIDGRSGVPQKRTANALQKALVDANRNRRMGGHKLAMVFITPKVHRTRKDTAIEFLDEYLCFLLEDRRLTLAWSFPDWAPDQAEHNEMLYPGAILALRYLRRPKS